MMDATSAPIAEVALSLPSVPLLFPLPTHARAPLCPPKCGHLANPRPAINADGARAPKTSRPHQRGVAAFHASVDCAVNEIQIQWADVAS